MPPRWYEGWHIIETEDSESFDLLVILNADGDTIAELHTHHFGLYDSRARDHLEALIELVEAVRVKA